MISLPPPLTEHGITAPGGDPAELRDVAGFLRTATAGFGQVSGRVRTASATVGTSWTGPAATLFAQRVAQTAAAVDTVPGACTSAATALETLANALEAAQRQALAAQAAAVGAQETLSAVGLKRNDLLTRPTGSDPEALRALDGRERAAEGALATARADGASAYGDAQEAARQAAVQLQAAADQIDAPPPPADPEVPPYESTGQWVSRQLGDLFYDPLAFWDPQLNGEDEWYKRSRIMQDLAAGGTTSLIWGLNRYRDQLFTHTVERPGVLRPGPVRFNPATLELERTWVQPVIRETVPDLSRTANIARLNRVAGPAGAVLGYGTAGLDQYMADRNRADLSAGEKAARAAGSSAIVGTTSLAGGIAGAKVGAMAGAAIGSFFPGPGTAIGGVVGGVVGGIVGSGVGQAVGSKVKDTVLGWFD